MAGRAPTPAESQSSVLRREPTQRRGRERLERLLAVAAALIAENGSDAVRMSDVAEQASVSIGSLYQYFPDKAAIIRTLAERYNAQGRACIEAELVGVQDMASLWAALGRLIDAYYRIFLEEPVMRDIWSGTQADKALEDINIADSRANGALLAQVLTRLKPEADREKLAKTAFLLMHLGGSTMRLAISLKRAEGDALVEAFKQMMLREVLAAG